MPIQFQELKEELKKISRFPKKLRISDQEIITDIPKMINTHISVIEANPKKRRFLPHYNRLLKVYELLSKERFYCFDEEELAMKRCNSQCDFCKDN